MIKIILIGSFFSPMLYLLNCPSLGVPKKNPRRDSRIESHKDSRMVSQDMDVMIGSKDEGQVAILQGCQEIPGENGFDFISIL